MILKFHWSEIGLKVLPRFETRLKVDGGLPRTKNLFAGVGTVFMNGFGEVNSQSFRKTRISLVELKNFSSKRFRRKFMQRTPIESRNFSKPSGAVLWRVKQTPRWVSRITARLRSILVGFLRKLPVIKWQKPSTPSQSSAVSVTSRHKLDKFVGDAGSQQITSSSSWKRNI